MDKFLIEIHAHTDESSNCGQMPAAQAVDLYHSLGYSAIMFTDHLHTYSFKKLLKEKPDASWDDKIDHLLEGYKNALRQAEKYDGFKVYLGCELRFIENDNDYLIFGLSEDKLRKMKDIIEYETEEGLPIVKNLGCTVIQAHPFRKNMELVDPELLDAIEVFNLHPNHNSRVAVAEKYAEDNGKIKTMGTDYHHLNHDNICATRAPYLPENEKELIKLLKSEDYIFEIGNKIVL